MKPLNIRLLPSPMPLGVWFQLIRVSELGWEPAAFVLSSQEGWIEADIPSHFPTRQVDWVSWRVFFFPSNIFSSWPAYCFSLGFGITLGNIQSWKQELLFLLMKWLSRQLSAAGMSSTHAFCESKLDGLINFNFYFNISRTCMGGCASFNCYVSEFM